MGSCFSAIDDACSELMSLMKAYFHSDIARLERNGVKVRILGRREGLEPEILGVVEEGRPGRRKRQR